MTVAGETILTGAAVPCPACGVDPLMRLGIGDGMNGTAVTTSCDCGPYSRETEYVSPRLAATAVTLARAALGRAGADPADRVEALRQVLEALTIARTP